MTKIIKIAVCASATGNLDKRVLKKAFVIGQEIAKESAVLLTGATTGYSYEAVKGVKEKGGLTVGISPAENDNEHIKMYKKPTDEFDIIIYTGFGMKGRNVVLVRSADIALFVGGGTGTLNEFTIAYDEGKVIGILKGSGGVADNIDAILKIATKKKPLIIMEADPSRLVKRTLLALSRSIT